jgi:hypothetical protein
MLNNNVIIIFRKNDELNIYIYIYIDTPSARRPRYIYGLILKETIGLGKNP